MFTLTEEVLRVQRCYRTLLHVLSRPGTLARLDLPIERKNRLVSVPSPLLLACECLLDEKVTVSGLTERGRLWAEEISRGMRVKLAEPEEADFVLSGVEASASELLSLKRGSLLAPEEGATLFVYVEEGIKGDAGLLSFAGPGVRGRLSLRVSAAVLDWASRRGKLCFEYPMGFEAFLFDREGNVLGIPRACEIEVLKPRRG
jgi:alpha-D-ribose 1-methylphosphonate 5-triphosphate synthase subunit PhnH